MKINRDSNEKEWKKKIEKPAANAQTGFHSMRFIDADFTLVTAETSYGNSEQNEANKRS